MKGDYNIRKIASRQKILFSIIIIYLFSGSYLAQAQTLIEFTPENHFPITANNGNISFLVNGTYSEAKQEKETWVFSNLRLSTSPSMISLLNASVQNCNITIRSISRFSSLQSSGTLRYNVTGQGIQTFNFNLIPKEREWSVIFDGEFTPEGKGWHLADDETITVTRQAVNITIFYMDYPADVAENNSFPFYQRHSAVIVTGIAVAIIAVTAVIIQTKNRKMNYAEDTI